MIVGFIGSLTPSGLTCLVLLLGLPRAPGYPSGTRVINYPGNFLLLKLVKTYLWSNMSDARLSGLAVLSIERELAEKLNFHHVIKDFASRKARKIHM